MTERLAQCGRTFVHAPHETDKGDCPGLAPPLIARRDVPRPLDPTYDGQRKRERVEDTPGVVPAALVADFRQRLFGLAETWESMAGAPNGPYETAARDLRQVLASTYERATDPGMMETLAAAEPDPFRSWMLSYPGENTDGPGWGDDDEVNADRACGWCRGSIENQAATIQARTIDAVTRAATDPIREPLARVGIMFKGDSVTASNDPWAEPEGTYDVGTLRAGLRAIAADATAREDHHTAHLAHAFLAGDPVSPEVDHNVDLDRLADEPLHVRVLAEKLMAGQRIGTADVVKAAESVRRQARS